MIRLKFYSIIMIILNIFCLFFLSSAQDISNIPSHFTLVTRDNCGVPGEQPHLVNGQNWFYTVGEIDSSIIPMDAALRSVAHGNKVNFRIQGLKPDARYVLKLSYLSDKPGRVQKFSIDNRTMQDSLALPAARPLEFLFEVDPVLYEDQQMELIFEKQEGSNAVVSEIELWSDDGDLLPILGVKASGNFNGRIRGEVIDQNSRSPLSGALVEAFAGKIRIGETQSDEEGRFSLQVKEESIADEEALIRLNITNEISKQTVFLPVKEIFMTPIALKPVPAAVDGLKNNKISLNGIWKFKHTTSSDFASVSAMAATSWPEIRVPGEWVMQGFTVEPNTYAGYFREFMIPADWKGKRIMLRCDAVYSKAEVFVNSQPAGGHHGGFTPFEMEITNLVNIRDRNSISMRVMNESLADTLASGTQYAAHQMGGIARKIYLYALPETHLTNLQVETDFDNSYQKAVLRLKYALESPQNRRSDRFSLSVGLIDPQGNKVDLGNGSRIAISPAATGAKAYAEIPVGKVLKWDAEHPNLYKLRVTLSKDKTPLETITQSIGFRKIEVRGEQVFVNGSPIKLRGINRHEVHPVRGRSLTDDLWKKDAELFRDANMNYIRTSHYPPAEEFIAACDSLGLFVELEAPFVWVGHAANSTWQKNNAQNAAYFNLISQGLQEMIRFYYNHPSVIIWSMANESNWGKNWESAFKLTNLIDPTRPKTFHDQALGGYNNYGSTSMQIANQHYPGPDGTKNIVDLGRPLLFGEYCHLNTYNRQEIVTDPGVRDYYGMAIKTMWDKMYHTEGCLGGAIWSGIDDVFELPDGKAVGYGEWGPIDGWRREKPEYWHIKKAYSPVRVLTEDVEISEDGKVIRVDLENRHDFTNLSEIDIQWEMEDQNGSARLMMLPRAKGTLDITPEKPARQGQILTLHFVSKRGFLIDMYEIPLGKKSSEQKPAARSDGKRTLSRKSGSITITGKNTRLEIDAQTGKIRSGFSGKTPILVGGPHLMMLPLISGPCSTEHSREIEPYNYTCHDWKMTSIATREDASGVHVDVEGQYYEAKGRYTITVSPSEEVRIDYTFESLIDVDPRQIGLVFDLEKQYDQLNWKRKGYWTAYPHNHIGRPEGSARAFPGERKAVTDFRVKPDRDWTYDDHPMGCNDFRATRRNILHALLISDDNTGLKVRSDGSQHVRAFMSDDKSHILIADFDTGGADIFLAGHYGKERMKMEPGSKVSGTVRLRMLP